MIFAAAFVLATTQVPAQTPKPAPVPISVTPGVVLEGVRPVAFAPAPNGSKIIVCLEDGNVRIIDSKTHQTVMTLTKHVAPAYAAAWSADGLYVATGDESARIFVESPLSGEKIREYRTHIKGIEKLSFNITRQYLMSTGKDDQINVYDLSSPSIKEAHKILGKGANFYGATFDPKLPYTISTGILGPGGRCYDCVTGKLTGFLATQDDQGVFDVAYNPNGTREVTAGKDGDAIIFDATTLKKLGTLKGHQDWVMYTAYSPNGKLIATASTDHTVKVWNAYNFQKIADLPAQSSVGSPLCFTSDGDSLVTVNDQGFLQFNKITPTQAEVETTPVAVKKKKTKRRHASS